VRSLRVEENVRVVLAVLSLCEEIPFDVDIYNAFGYLSATLRECGSPVGDFDQAIAAAVLCSDGEIITRDRHFEKIPGLKVTGIDFYSRAPGKKFHNKFTLYEGSLFMENIEITLPDNHVFFAPLLLIPRFFSA
jgi:hypothetical protein